MKFNSGLVSFYRSAAYVHRCALKNMRQNNPIEALELMRHAVERSPDNRDYLLDLAEIYCELGDHNRSNRILLDLLSQKDAPAECYYGLALNQFIRNDCESARRALALYLRYAKSGEYAHEANALRMNLDYNDSIQRPFNRKLARAVQVANSACDALRDGNATKACKRFERSFTLYAPQNEMRTLYAMALSLCGDREQAVRLAEESASVADASVRALCIASQVLNLCGEATRARELIEHAMRLHPTDVELRLLCVALCDLKLYALANEALKSALRESPYDRELLHMRAVALHLSGAKDSQCEPFWLRILRIDPEDSIAQYYHELALQGKLMDIEPVLGYSVPDAECRRRLLCIVDILNSGLEASIELWRGDPSFRKLLMWAAGSGIESCARAAVMIIASADDAQSEDTMRELFYRNDIPLSVKLHALLFLKLRGAHLNEILPPDVDARDGLLPRAEQLLQDALVGERQLVRYAADYVEAVLGTRPLAALMLMWKHFRECNAKLPNPINSTQEASAALAWNYLLSHGENVSVKKLVSWFGCSRRRMVYYAAYMAGVSERGLSKAEDEHEDH